MVGFWLVAYVTKQLFGGRDQLAEWPRHIALSIPVILVHTELAMTTIGLGATNMVFGLRKLQYGTRVGAMVGGIARHRRLRQMMQWTLGGTLLTIYAVYGMLFYWFSAE